MVGRPRLEPPVPLPAGFKFCFKCYSAHPATAFAIDRAKWDGLRPYCRACDDARRKAYAAKQVKQPTNLSRCRANWLADKARLERFCLDSQEVPND